MSLSQHSSRRAAGDTALSVRGLSKCYTLAHNAPKHTLATDALLHRLKTLGKASQTETFWALQDVSFEIAKGDVVGIIGRNGAGKSTLLKILSRITEPTSGQIDLYGRVGSLLEVGTGFHQELTGRENIYMNGAILGMSKREITRQFDAIVDFSGTEQFLDTPVKRYSSGMYVRLAFAVAAHLNPEILIVDEVLAVGDSEFQKKCLGKMEDVAREGRTVLFVSHNMGAVNRLCNSCILLQNGFLTSQGMTDLVVTKYLSENIVSEGERHWDHADTSLKSSKMRLLGLRVMTDAHTVSATIDIQRPFFIKIKYELLRAFPSIRVCFRLLAEDGTIVFTSTDNNDDNWNGRLRRPGIYESSCLIPGNFLNSGLYSVTITADVPFVETLVHEESSLSFFVEQTGGISGRYPEKWAGVVCPMLEWEVEHLEDKVPMQSA